VPPSYNGDVNVALLGFGTVGQAVARLLLDSSAPLTLTHIFNRQVSRKRADWVPSSVAWTERFEDVLAPGVDLVVEVVGGLDPAGRWHREAIAAGKSVVTANKQLMAHEGGELLRLAAQRGVHFGFEAAVAGGIPVIRAIREGLAGDQLQRITGILNGTCNYMLTRMEAERLTFDAVLAEAQARGYAEADPTDDLEGYDARAKLCILARIGLHVAVRPADVPCRSIRPLTDVDFIYAHRLGYTIRQVSRVERHPGGEAHPASVDAAVEPALVRNGSVLSRVRGSENLVLTLGERGGETGFFGRGAGGDPTAVAVLSDVLAIARHSAPPGWFREVADDRPASVRARRADPHYVRFVVRDKPGIIAALAHALSRHDLNIDAVLQESGWPKDALPFVVTLEPAPRHVVDQAIDDIAPLDFHVERPVVLPIVD
jgi:homoserine dehydrogenase